MQHRLERLAATGPQGWVPAVDLCETATAFLITVEGKQAKYEVKRFKERE